jgi:tetratricopeptide (TPR) repeat protein
MRETNASAATYAKHYSRTWGQLMKSEGRFPLQEYGDRSVLTTWTISYEQVQRQSEEAACLLRLWGFLDSGEVWYELIAAGLDLTAGTDVPAWLLAIAQDELAFGEAMGLLSRYSLAEGKDGTDSHSMHSVLHRWCRYLVGQEEQQELGCLAAGLVASSVPLESDAEFWIKRKQVMAHGLCVSSWIEEHSGWDKERVVEGSRWLGCSYKLGCLLDDEDRQRAEQMYQRALEGYEKNYGPEHALTLHTVNKLGMLYANQDRREEAEQMYWRALDGYERIWGPEHTSTLNTIHILGMLYADQDRWEEAKQMYQRALDGYERIWGPEHTSTLNTVNSLGNLNKILGRLEEAEQMYQRALDGYEKIWGPEHLSTLNTTNNLGILYTDLGKIEEAKQMLQRALDGYEKAWGLEHPETLCTVNNLGNLYAILGKMDEAEQMYQRALAGREKAWGLEHTSTLGTVYNLGHLYADLGRLQEAEQMYQRALAGWEKAWGPEHTLILDTVNNLGNLNKILGRLEEAEQMYQRALAGKEKMWGPEHTSTLNTVNNLGVLYVDLGKIEKAEQMLQRALDGYAKATSSDNVMTYVPALNNMWAFASLRESQGLIDDARDWYLQALLGYQKTLGPHHGRCELLRNQLAFLVDKAEGQSPAANTTVIEDYSSRKDMAESVASLSL